LKSPVYDTQGKYNEIITRYKNELNNIQSQKKLLQNEVNLLRNLRKGLINDNLIYMERFRKLKSEESALQKKNQKANKKTSLYKCNNESVHYNLKSEDSNLDSASIYSTNNDTRPNDFNLHDITLQRMESSINNSFAVYESITKIINESFQPPKIEENFNISSNSDSKESLNTEGLNISTTAANNDNSLNIDSMEEKTPCSADDERIIIPLNDSPSVPQSKNSTLKKLKKSKKYYGK